MSHTYYGRQWADTQKALGDVIKYLEVPPDKIKPEFDRLAGFQKLAMMYVKYIDVMRHLEQCYDQLVHPQKRRNLRQILDGVMGRILEVKNEMVKLELSEYHFVDDVISDLKYIPSDLDIPIPRYFTGERVRVLMDREKRLGEILEKLGGDTHIEVPEKPMTRAEAVLLIQRHERARQGRRKAREAKEAYVKKMIAQWQPPNIDHDLAATTIQTCYRGFYCRLRYKVLKKQDLVFLGMDYPPPREDGDSPTTLALAGEIDRRRIQELNEEEYQQALLKIPEYIEETEGEDIKQMFVDQIRQWFLECRDAVGKFPNFPAVEDGGSLVLFKERDPAEIEAELKEQDEKKGKKGKDDKKKEKDKKDKKKEKEKKEKEKDKKKKKKKKGEDEGWLIAPSQFVPVIEEGSATYKKVWACRNEVDNIHQQFDLEFVKREKRSEVEEKIRLQVDELMREELIRLKLVIDGEKTKKKKGKGKKRGKKGKGKKGKKIKDLTPERSVGSLYEELVTEGIIVPHPCVMLNDFVGEFNYVASTLRQASIEPMPSLSDVRRVVTEYAILPLGSPKVHELGPHIRSIMLTGPHGTGKQMLVHAVCTETGANLFNLTSEKLVDRYPGKSGLKIMLSMIFKVALALQPSVLFIKNCERMFRKKLPKEEKSDPKRLKKELPKLMKLLKPGDRVLLMGTTNTPFHGEMKPMMKTYEKIVMIPRPDYASRHVLWRSIIAKHGGTVTADLHMSCLVKVSDGYTPGMIDTVCASVLSESRVNRLDEQPLVADDFVIPLSKLIPVFKEEEEAYPAWFVRTPLGKKKEQAAQEAAEILAAKEKEEARKKKRK